MFPPALLSQAEILLARFRRRGQKIVTAESCTGGLLAGLFTEIAGASDVFERGFVVYSNAAKHELLDVPQHQLDTHGAVSGPVAQAMAEGALRKSRADVAVAITGIAGPGGGTAQKPVGLVWFGGARRGGAAEAMERPHIERPHIETPHIAAQDIEAQAFEHRFDFSTRSEIRLAALSQALAIASLVSENALNARAPINLVGALLKSD